VIRLHRFRFSTNVDRIAMVLAHKGLADQVESVWVDPSARSSLVALSGQELVPVIEHEGQVLSDSPAILEYLDARFPEPPLFPPDPAHAAHVRIFVEWFNRVWKVAPNAIAAGDADAAHALALQRHQDLFEGMLSDGRAYLFWTFGAADVIAWPFLRYATDAEPEDTDPFHQVLRDELSLEGRPHLAAWIRRVGEAQGRAISVV
jgi:glutathione S-transferase